MALIIPPRGTICPAIAKEPFVSVVYGYPGVGKTPVLSVLPDNFYIDLQLGTRYVSCRRVAVSCWEEFEEAAAAWRREPTRFVTIDPITVLYEWAVWRATEEYRNRPVGKNFDESGAQTILDLTAQDSTGKPFAPGYRYVREVFMRAVRMFWPGSANRLICVGHVRDALMADIGMGEKGGKTVGEFDGKDLDIDGKLRNIFLSDCDLGLYAYQGITQRSDGKTTVTVPVFKLTAAARKAQQFVKCRCPHLLGRTFVFNNPATVDDWRQIFPDSIAELCGPVKTAAAAVPAAPVPAPALSAAVSAAKTQ